MPYLTARTRRRLGQQGLLVVAAATGLGTFLLLALTNPSLNQRVDAVALLVLSAGAALLQSDTRRTAPRGCV